jgi:DNA ligase-1
MMSRFQSSKANLDNCTLSYVVFDVIQYKGKSVSSLPLMERKQMLDEIITQDTSLVAKVKYIEGHGSAKVAITSKPYLSVSRIVCNKPQEVNKRLRGVFRVICWINYSRHIFWRE